MATIRVLDRGVLYENPLPQLRSRHAYFPCCVPRPDGSLLASYVLGQAFESVDLATWLAQSRDGGQTWEQIGPVYPKRTDGPPLTDFLKITQTPDALLAFGYCFDRSNPDLPIGNPKSGGLLESTPVLLRSRDGGVTWDLPEPVPHSLAGPIEASAPLLVLSGGDWIAPIANFYAWDGAPRQPLQGRLLRSSDGGSSWDDSAVTMCFPGSIAVWEQRACELEPGSVLVIAWNEDLAGGGPLPNYYVISRDGGRSFAPPQSTGIMGQASSVTSLRGNRILALHCLRRGTERPGIYAFVVDTSGGWNVKYGHIVWEPSVPLTADRHFSDAFAYVKFGQPSAVHLGGNEYVMVHWAISDGQARILWHRLAL